MLVASVPAGPRGSRDPIRPSPPGTRVVAWKALSGTRRILEQPISSSKIAPTRLTRSPVSAFARALISSASAPASPAGLSANVCGQRLEAEWLQPEPERVQRADVGIVVAVELARGAQHGEQVLHRDQVAHLLLGDAEDGLLPGAYVILERIRDVRAAEGVRGEQVLGHQRVLDLGRDAEQEDRVVPTAELRRHRERLVEAPERREGPAADGPIPQRGPERPLPRWRPSWRAAGGAPPASTGPRCRLMRARTSPPDAAIGR